MINYLLLLVSFLFISSCSPVSSVVSLAANAGISSKGFAASVDDSFLKAKIVAKISSLKVTNISNITVSVSLGEVLLTGYSDNQINRLKLVENVWKVEGVKEVFNEIKIESDVSISERTEDVLFESRLMTRLLFKSGINSNNYSLNVVGGDVYVIGLAENLEEKATIEKFLENMNDIPKLVTIINVKKKGD